MSRPKVTLALGGGGARGLAHLGVLAGLRAAGLEIHRLVGVSIGSLAGAMYAFDSDIDRVREKTLIYINSPEFQRFQHEMHASSSSTPSDAEPSRWDRLKTSIRANYICRQVMRYPSLLDGEILQHAVEHLLPERDIAEAAIPLSVVAIDLLAGDRAVLESGPVRDAVRASSSIPGVFPPVTIEDRLLCDIGVLNSLPTPAASTYESDQVIAVDVSAAPDPIESCSTAVDVLIRMHDIGERLFREHVQEMADVVIRPDVGHVAWHDFSSPEELVETGRIAVQKTLSELA